MGEGPARCWILVLPVPPLSLRMASRVQHRMVANALAPCHCLNTSQVSSTYGLPKTPAGEFAPLHLIINSLHPLCSPFWPRRCATVFLAYHKAWESASIRSLGLRQSAPSNGWLNVHRDRQDWKLMPSLAGELRDFLHCSLINVKHLFLLLAGRGPYTHTSLVYWKAGLYHFQSS